MKEYLSFFFPKPLVRVISKKTNLNFRSVRETTDVTSLSVRAHAAAVFFSAWPLGGHDDRPGPVGPGCLLHFALPFTLVVAARNRGDAPESAPRYAFSVHPLPSRSLRPQPAGLVEPGQSRRAIPSPCESDAACVLVFGGSGAGTGRAAAHSLGAWARGRKVNAGDRGFVRRSSMSVGRWPGRASALNDCTGSHQADARRTGRELPPAGHGAMHARLTPPYVRAAVRCCGSARTGGGGGGGEG
jgi:hypothetical protein